MARFTNQLINHFEVLASDHVSQARGWTYPDQRIDFINKVVERYWNAPLLQKIAAASLEIRKKIEELRELRATAQELLEKEVENLFRAHEAEVLAAEAIDRPRVIALLIRRSYQGHPLAGYIPDKLDEVVCQLQNMDTTPAVAV